MGVGNLVAVKEGLSLGKAEYNVSGNPSELGSASPRDCDIYDVPEERRWGLNKTTELTVTEENGTAATMTSY